MCGRYRLKDPKAAFDYLEAIPTFEFLPRFNIAPTQRVPVAIGPGRIEEMTWGIVPVWAKEKSRPLINARVETIREKRSFKSSFAQRRCLMAADGFYEWSRIGKHPYLFTIRGDAPFAIGAVWEKSSDISRCCLLTTTNNALLDPIHNRMPVIVRPEDWPEWYAPGDLAEASFERITTPYPPGEMSALAVSALVNSARTDSPACCEPAGSSPSVPPGKLTIRRKEPPPPDVQQTFGF
jgi:putative SOS response-associated peptidase YedK